MSSIASHHVARRGLSVAANFKLNGAPQTGRRRRAGCDSGKFARLRPSRGSLMIRVGGRGMRPRVTRRSSWSESWTRMSTDNSDSRAPPSSVPASLKLVSKASFKFACCDRADPAGGARPTSQTSRPRRGAGRRPRCCGGAGTECQPPHPARPVSDLRSRAAGPSRSSLLAATRILEFTFFLSATAKKKSGINNCVTTSKSTSSLKNADFRRMCDLPGGTLCSRPGSLRGGMWPLISLQVRDAAQGMMSTC